MEPVGQGVAPPPPTGERDIVASAGLEPSAAGTATPTEGIEDMSTSWYLTIPGIGTIDLDATELPSNDREILEAVMERVFANPSLLDVVVLDPLTLCQDRNAGGLAPSATPEAMEGVLGQFEAGAESAAIEPPPTTVEETTDATCSSLQR
jgi:hypothetical protein